MKRGLGYIGIGQEEQPRTSEDDKMKDFLAHFGSSPLVLTNMWYDFHHVSIPEAQLQEKDKKEKGFMPFMIAHFFLWTYPKNARLTKTRFKICMRYLEGKELWYWPKKIRALKGIKIIWSPDLDSNDTKIIALTVDGVNCAAWEKKHPTLNKDPACYDHKQAQLLWLDTSMKSQSESINLRLLGSRDQSGVERMIESTMMGSWLLPFHMTRCSSTREEANESSYCMLSFSPVTFTR
jgi:hypothetical protein